MSHPFSELVFGTAGASALGQSKFGPQAKENVFRWATVMSVSPLRVQLDGDTAPIDRDPYVMGNIPQVGARVWVQLFARRVLVLGTVGDDTGWIDGGTGSSVMAVNGTNLTLTGSKARVLGGRCTIMIDGTIKVALGQVDSHQDVANTNIGTMALPFRTSCPWSQPLTSGASGRGIWGHIQTGTSSLIIAAIGGNTVMAVGDTVSLGGTYML